MFIKCCNKFHSTFFSFSRRTINPFIPEVKRTFQTFSNRVWRKKILSPPLFFFIKITNHTYFDELGKRKREGNICWCPTGDYFFSAKTFAGLNGTVTGWGATAESGAISQTLQEVTVPILSNADCRATKYPSQRITDNMLCAGYQEGSKDSCQVINNKFFLSFLSSLLTPLLRI